MKVLIEVVRKESVKQYSCISYRNKEVGYLHLYSAQSTVTPIALQQIVPIHDKDIIEINFKYEG